jgi:hypothetical protein
MADAAAGDEGRAMEWNAALAAIFLHQGRHDEAVAIHEAVLKYPFGGRVCPSCTALVSPKPMLTETENQ